MKRPVVLPELSDLKQKERDDRQKRKDYLNKRIKARDNHVPPPCLNDKKDVGQVLLRKAKDEQK